MKRVKNILFVMIIIPVSIILLLIIFYLIVCFVQWRLPSIDEINELTIEIDTVFLRMFIIIDLIFSIAITSTDQYY